MPLPDLVEIVPLDRPVRAQITVPGSKSITNRALILAALSGGGTVLRGALWSEDTEVMTGALRRLGFVIAAEPDPAEPCNRTIFVAGLGGRIPRAGTAAEPLELFAGNAGTAARFLAALVCLGDGAYRLHGTPRMHERPQAALFAALRELGCRVDSPNDKLPAVIHGRAPDGGRGTRACKVSVAESSQFASALLLAARPGGWRVEVAGAGEEEQPYIEMTRRLVDGFPVHGGEFLIEPDASSGSYFWAAGWLCHVLQLKRGAAPAAPGAGSPVSVKAWPESGWQIDAGFPGFLPLPRSVSRASQLGDSIMTAAVLAADADAGAGGGLSETHPWIRFTDLGRLRVQECERVAALRAELTKCGAKVAEEGDTLAVCPSRLHGAEIETYNDHRMAMCFAVLGLKVPGIRLRNPACVKKTFPNFFQKLAAAPPHGLGVVILDARTGRKLENDDLFAAG